MCNISYQFIPFSKNSLRTYCVSILAHFTYNTRHEYVSEYVVFLLENQEITREFVASLTFYMYHAEESEPMRTAAAALRLIYYHT